MVWVKKNKAGCTICGLHISWAKGKRPDNPPPCPHGCDDRMAVTWRKLVRLDLDGDPNFHVRR